MKTLFVILSLMLGSISSQAAAKDLQISTYQADAAGFHATSTIIESDTAVLVVDAQFTRSEAHRLVAQVLKTGKPLTQVFITHAHPDHYFGLEIVRGQFPDVEVITTAEVKEQMASLGPSKLAAWKPMYGQDLTDIVPTADRVVNGSFVFGGEKIEILELQAAEIEHSTALFLPTSKTLIAGDAVYDGVHPWLVETDAARRKAWLANLDRFTKLAPTRVVAGHQANTPATGLAAIEMTRSYILAFDRALAATHDADGLKTQMMELYPDLALPIILDLSIKAALSGDMHTH